MNLFLLFDSEPGWQEAEAEIKEACLRFQSEIRALQERHADVGADDTVSREAIGAFVGSLIGSCTDQCLEPEWHIINHVQMSTYNLTWDEARERAVKLGLLPLETAAA